jgi:DNA polymerase-3 subunit epsilon
MSSVKLLYLDVETTGLDPEKDEIRQVACKAFVGEKEDKMLNVKVKYNKKCSFLTKKQQEEHNEAALTNKTAFEKFLKYLRKHVNPYDPNDKFTLVAYNAPHDDSFLRQWFEDKGNKFYGSFFYNGPMCVMQKAIYYLTISGMRNQVQSMKMEDICRYFGVPFDKNKLHEAGYDVLTMIKLDKAINHEMRGMWSGVNTRNN